MQSDRYELLHAEPHLAGAKRDLVGLPPMPAAEFKGVIEGPARRVVEGDGRLTIEPALTERLIADAQGADALRSSPSRLSGSTPTMAARVGSRSPGETG